MSAFWRKILQLYNCVIQLTFFSQKRARSSDKHDYSIACYVFLAPEFKYIERNQMYIDGRKRSSFQSRHTHFFTLSPSPKLSKLVINLRIKTCFLVVGLGGGGGGGGEGSEVDLFQGTGE